MSKYLHSIIPMTPTTLASAIILSTTNESLSETVKKIKKRKKELALDKRKSKVSLKSKRK